MVVDGRYRVIDRLGSGAAGNVYRVLDLTEKKELALKLAASDLNQEEALTFQKEFHALRALSHPNIVRVFDFGVTKDGRAYFTMELLEGERFDRTLGKDVEFAVRATGRVLATLDYIHSRGLVHCDLKPENILIRGTREAPEVKLLDFGLASRSDVLGSSGARGTFAYMAPEMSRWGKADQRADIYSLGVVLYEALSGRNAFEGEDPVAIVRAHLNKSLEPLSRMREDVPEDLDRIVSRMVEKEPSRRYRSAAEVLTALSRLLPGAVGGTVLASTPQLLTSELIGRDSHLSRLTAMFQRAAKGQPSCCLLVGDRGTGKSRLLQELKGVAQLEGGLALVGTCSKAQGEPLVPMRSISDQVRMRGHSMNVEFGPEEMSALLDGKLEASIVFAKIYESLAVLPEKEKKPVLIAIEDFNFADEMTQKMTAFIARSLKTEQILLIVTTETNQSGDTLEKNLLAEAPFVKFEVGSLKKTQTALMIEQMLGSDRAVPELTDWTYDHSDGNPLLIEEILNTAVSKQAVVLMDGQWVVNGERLKEIRIPVSVAGIVDNWLQRLNEGELQLLRDAAVLGEVFDTRLLQEFTELEQDEFFNALYILESQNILLSSQETARLSFTHKWVRDIIYETLSEGERGRLHERALRLLESLYKEDERPIDSLAYHALRARAVDEAVHYNTLAAENALKVHALRNALNYYQAALSVLPPDREGTGPAILESAGDLHRTLGEYDKALEKYEKVVSLTGPSPRLSIKIGKTYVRMGQSGNALAVLESALNGTRGEDMNLMATVLNELALVHLAQSETERADESARKALVAAQGAADRGVLSYSYHILGLIELNRKRYDEAIDHTLQSLELKKEMNDTKGMAGSYINLGILYWNKGLYDKAVESYTDSLKLAERTGDIALGARAHNNIGLVEMRREHWEEAGSHLRESLAVFERLNDRSVLGHLYLNLGSVAEKQGRWPDALSLYEKSISVFEKMGQLSNLATSLQDAGKLHLMMGNMGDAETRLKRALNLAEKSGDAVAQASALLYLGYFHMESFQWKRALDCVSRSLEMYGERGISHMLPTVKSILSEIHTGKGEFVNARQIGEEALTEAIEQDNLSQVATSHYALALLSVALEDRRSADDHFEKAIETMKNLDQRYEMGRALLEAGKWKIRLWRESRKNEEFGAACSFLKDAEVIFRDLNARRDLEHVHEAGVDLVEKLSVESLAPSAREDQLKTIYEVSEVINSIFNLDDLLNRVIDLVIHLLDAERGVLMLMDERSGSLRVAAGRRIDSSTIEDASQISTSVLNRVTNKRKPVISGNALVDRRFSRSKSVLNHQIKSLLCVPLMVRDRVLGTIYVDSRVSPDLFTKEDELFLDSLANLIAVAIENSRHHREVHEERDHLRLEVKKRYHFRNLVGATEQMKNLYDLIERVADSDSNVLILGETGTGKELVARAIHYSSRRADKKFVTVVVSALPETLLESELFGHKKGSFTGAVADQKGLFEEADGGTIFLDEIGDAPGSVQSKLLRVIEEGETRRVGDTVYRKVDVRVICATNRRLTEEVRKGRFREDLFYRLNVINISIPPLRGRKKDIPLLAEHFLKVYGDKTGKRLTGIDREAMDYMLNYDWPGNVRELENCIERAVVMTKSERIEAQDLYPLFGRKSDNLPLRELKDDTEKTRILEALIRTHGNVTRAAKELGIHRQQLQRLMKKHSLSREEFLRLTPIS